MSGSSSDIISGPSFFACRVLSESPGQEAGHFLISQEPATGQLLSGICELVKHGQLSCHLPGAQWFLGWA